MNITKKKPSTDICNFVILNRDMRHISLLFLNYVTSQLPEPKDRVNKVDSFTLLYNLSCFNAPYMCYNI